jgi:serine/threonine protein kinase
MAHLHEENVVHRDLAARNVLLDHNLGSLPSFVPFQCLDCRSFFCSAKTRRFRYVACAADRKESNEIRYGVYWNTFGLNFQIRSLCNLVDVRSPLKWMAPESIKNREYRYGICVDLYAGID